jgi:hypothetical protein
MWIKRFARFISIAGACVACAASQTAEGRPVDSAAAELEQDPSCVAFWPEVRYRNYGYDHIVHLANRCDVPAHCRVSTDVNAKPVNVEVPAHDRLEVLTFRGSAAREFVPRVECRFRV